MTEQFEDFKRYLPQYLSAGAQTKLFAELGQFPNNIDQRFYTTKLENESNIFQGDGLPNMWVTDLPGERIGKTRVLVISNSCDTSRDNKAWLGSRLIYCPIISVSKLQAALKGSAMLERDVPNYLDTVRKQHISSMLYLPFNERLGEEAIALLDRMNNCNARSLNIDEIVETRLFTLSDYGFYLFLYKLSIHLTRIRENVARN